MVWARDERDHTDGKAPSEQREDGIPDQISYNAEKDCVDIEFEKVSHSNMIMQDN